MKKIILGLYTLAFLTTGINANAQIKESTGEPVYFIDYRIRYVENDTTLSEEGKELIVSYPKNRSIQKVSSKLDFICNGV